MTIGQQTKNPLDIAVKSPIWPGRLTPEWIEHAPLNLWKLETSDPWAKGHRNAFIGNGFIGQRIGIEGDASAYPIEGDPTTPSGCLVHGLWGEFDLMAPPKWALLQYFDGGARFTRNTGLWTDYRQSTDLQNGIVKTEVTWVNGGRTTGLVTRVYIDRCNAGRCVISRTISPQFSGMVSMVDEIDGTFIEDAQNCHFFHDKAPQSPMSLELRMGPRQRQVAVVSRLNFCDQFTSKDRAWANLKADPDVQVDVVVTEKKASRTLSFSVEAGRSYTVTKVVALVADSLAPAPRIAAWNLAEAGAFDLARMEEAHVSAWKKLWQRRIEVPHPRLQVLIHSALYQFYSNLREGGTWSMGPAGLSSHCWGGHAFWDGDLWMFPSVCLLHPELAKGFVEYRSKTLPGAQRNAQASGNSGAAMAWESAEFGDEVIPHRVYHHQHHVNSDVALAQWWFWKISGDDNWFREKGALVVIECARFWESRVTYVEALDRYEIRQVCCADEFAEIQNNNAYTNYSAVKTLELAVIASEFIGQPVPISWRGIIQKMWIPADAANHNIFEYECYAGQQIKQADTALLVYPYEMPMTDVVKANIVDYYRTKYPENSIMMSSAFDGIVDCELNRAEQAWESLLKLLPHFREPYLLVSESPANEVISFMTGLGGFLQLMMMGFGGIRIRADGLQIEPRFPAAFGEMTLRGVHYGGVSFDLQLKEGSVKVLNPSKPISFHIGDTAGKSWL